MSRIPNFADIAFEKAAPPSPVGSAEPWLTPEGIPVKSVYGEADLAGIDFLETWRVNSQLSFSFEGLNLNDEPRVSSMPIPGSFREISVYGPRYYLGARYRF